MARKSSRRTRPQRRGKSPPPPAASAPAPVAAGPAQKLRAAAFTVSLLLLSLYIPLAIMAYTEPWYYQNCKWHQRCLVLGELAPRSISNLTSFFLHIEPLHERWSDKERAHLTEVRVIYDVLAGLAVAAALLVFANYRRVNLRRATLINIGVILSLLLLVPVFGYFWRHVFHELLFSNELWRTNRDDITWYITPRVMFRNSMVALILGGVAINLAVLAFDAWRRRTGRLITKP